MNSLHEFQAKWGRVIGTPWENATVIGSVESAYLDLLKLLRQSVEMDADGSGGECISALLVGPGGVGKTFAVKAAINQLRAEGSLIIPITLHGSICSDDKSSMRQIFSQFQRCLIGGSTLDTFTRATFQQGSLSEWCDRLSRLIQECTRSDHIVIIVLEDFDCFCHSKVKQSLLYNLFDLMHVKDARFVVVGVTTKPDASELLEKRIKSRFQLRKIVVSPPDSLDDMIRIIESIICSGEQPEASKGTRAKKGVKSQPSLVGTIRDVLGSKELRQQWSLYRDLGLSTRDFATSALSALVNVKSEQDIEHALVNCCHAFARTASGDVSAINVLIPALAIREHIVLIGLLKLHQDRKRPKCFVHALKEIESFEKKGSVAGTCRHSKRAYWHAFQGLVRMGLIEMVEYTGVSSAVAPPPMFSKCRLTMADSYWAWVRNSHQDPNSSLPNEVHEWASLSRNLNVDT